MYYTMGDGGLSGFGRTGLDLALDSAGMTTDITVRRGGWQQLVVDAIMRYATSVRTEDDLTWMSRLPTRNCYSALRALGIDPTPICVRFTAEDWASIQAYVASTLSEAETEKWDHATCEVRALVDGGGSVCTAADGSTRVTCYHTDGSGPTVLASGPCPAGTGGMVQIQRQRLPSEAESLLAKPRVGTVIGKVVDETGAVVARAKVTLGPPAGSFVTAGAYTSGTTASNGTLLIQKAAGTYDLVVEATGYSKLVVSGVVLTSGTVTNLGSLRVLVPVSDVVEQEDVVTCEAGQTLDPATGLCMEVVTCEAGQTLDPATGLCVATEAKTDEEPKWYSSPWVWVIGGVVVLGGGYLAWNAWGKKAA
jgi:hypothetical protein